MQCELPVEAANNQAKAGTMGATIEKILAEQKPEAVYFGLKNGRRTAFVVVNLDSAADIPRLAEPWFLAFNASIEAQVVMLPEDLAKAGPAIGEAVAKFA
jgi:hypothetical protein